MSERTSGGTFPDVIPREVRSKLLHFDQDTTSQKHRAYEEDKIREFKYDPLPSNEKQIRVLRLWPGVLDNPQIDCELFEARFDEYDRLIRLPTAMIQGRAIGAATSGETSSNLVEYEALSWRWGDESNGKYAVMIHKNGTLYRKRVSKTLGLALKYLRTEKKRFLWIDAICINQSDSDERSSQVAMMSLVYTAAANACVWLGEDNEESTMAIRFIREEINQLKNFDSLCTEKQHAAKWGSLLVLMQRDWFSRRWVVQEIVLAKSAIVYYGQDKIEWEELAIAVELFVEVETATHRLSELMKEDEKFALIPNRFEHISELGASLLVNATARVYRGSEVLEGTRAKRGVSPRSLLSLEYLVTSLSIFDCGRPHDSVYALVAIARDARPFAPSSLKARTRNDKLVAEVCSDFVEEKPYILDYNSPYPDVCKDFTQFCIERCASVDKVQALDILCRPWAKDWLPGEFPNSTIQMEEMTFVGSTDSDQPNTDAANSKSATADKPGCDPIIRRWFQKPHTQRERTNDSKNVATNQPAKTSLNQEKRTHRRRKFGANRTRDAEVIAQRNSDEETAKKLLLHPKETELGLPSWVAKITAAPFDIFGHPGMDMVKMGRKNADPLVGIPQDGHRNYNAAQTKKIDLKSLKFRKRSRSHPHHYSLYVKGFWLDTIVEVAQVSQGGAIPGEWLDLAGWPEARQTPKHGENFTDFKDPPSAFWRTLVADRGMYDRNPPYYYARACRQTILKGGLRSGAVDTTALIHNERNSIVAEFCRRVQAVIWNRALIKTEQGHLGLVADKVRVGDMVCILYGCSVPIILRKKPLKTGSQLKLEQFEDGVEAMKRLVKNCKKARARKKHWNSLQQMQESKVMEHVRVTREETSTFNEKHKQARDRHEEEKIKKCQDASKNNPDTSPKFPDDGSEDDSDEETDDDEGNANGLSAGEPTSTNGEKGTLGQGYGAPGEASSTTQDITPRKDANLDEEAQDERAKAQAKADPDTQNTKQEAKQAKAKERDPWRHYEFFGEAYIHGMMDGEAIRQNFFYRLKPDHIFEIR